MEYVVNFREVTYGLTEALDLVGIDDIRHGKRVAYMAAECAEAGGFDAEFIDDIICIGMLHDCGVSTTDMHRELVTRLEWKDEHLHCERGAELLNKVALYSRFAPVVLYHHTHWEDLQGLPVDEKTKKMANLIYLVDRVDALRAQIDGDDLDKRDTILEILEAHTNTFFLPQLVELFREVSNRNAFWFYLEEEPLDAFLLEWVGQGETVSLSYENIKEVAMMFSDVVDAKSPFTYEHSYGVAALAVMLAERLELPCNAIETIELAALLHDLGKLRVHDAVLNKDGRLDHSEQMAMHRHGFDSDMILRKINGLREVGRLASMHHEMLDGKGYPYNLKGDQIPLGARIIAVADIFQALVQDRPYRTAMDAGAAAEILQEMVEEGKLDGRIVDLIHADPDRAFAIAKCMERGQEALA